jgi:hypothetical protein
MLMAAFRRLGNELKLNEPGISRDQSSGWRQLAAIDETDSSGGFDHAERNSTKASDARSSAGAAGAALACGTTPPSFLRTGGSGRVREPRSGFRPSSLVVRRTRISPAVHAAPAARRDDLIREARDRPAASARPCFDRCPVVVE